MLRSLLLLYFMAACLVSMARLPEENVVILTGKEEYEFTKGKEKAEVRNSIRHEYLATRRAGKISPGIFYNDIIRLDKASGGSAQYKNVNSPTVFHDDSKVCFFNIDLAAKGKKARWSSGAHGPMPLISPRCS